MDEILQLSHKAHTIIICVRTIVRQHIYVVGTDSPIVIDKHYIISFHIVVIKPYAEKNVQVKKIILQFIENCQSLSAL